MGLDETKPVFGVSVNSQALEGKPSNRLEGNSFQSNSLSIVVLFLEIETFLLINKLKHLFVITWIFIQIYL